jgi:hypothetical protein
VHGAPTRRQQEITTCWERFSRMMLIEDENSDFDPVLLLHESSLSLRSVTVSELHVWPNDIVRESVN